MMKDCLLEKNRAGIEVGPNKAAAGNAGFTRVLRIGHCLPGVPEPECWPI